MIEFRQVNKSFRRNHVLRDITFDVAAGDRIALVGSNGAGKTTLIRCLLGEYQYDGGILINGKESRRQRTEILKRVGFVPQMPPPLKMGVAQLVHYAAGLCGTDVAQMRTTIETLGLEFEAIARQSFNKLSGGQKQKVLIGIALGRECDLLVMDEPTANLDPQARQVFFKLLAERATDVAMILSSHRLTEVAALVNRVVELDAGNLVLDDRVEGAARLDAMSRCRIELSRPDPAFAKTIAEWGFLNAPGGSVWQGRLYGADRLRFLGVLSRYSALIKSVHIDEVEEKVGASHTARSA